MSKKYSKFLTALFCIVLAAFFAAVLFFPKRTFSEDENRYLQTFPEFSLESLKSGKFMKEFETFVTDQFPGRDAWVAAKCVFERLSGKQENNGIYFCGSDTLIAKVDDPDPDQVEKNLQSVQALTEKTDKPVYFSLIPGAAYVWADKLPDNAPTADQAALLEQAQEAVPGAHWVDLASTLTDRKDEYIFYRTDHHWTSLGAKYAYEALAPAMGLTTAEGDWMQEPQVVSDSFFGTSWSSSGVRWVPADEIWRYAPDDGITVTSNFTGQPEEGALYHPEKLEQKDKYTYFLGGNQPLCVIKNENLPDAPKVLVLRDSYSDSLAPFLAQSCSEVHLFDVRYNLNSVAQYAEENYIDEILVLYSVANFVAEKNIFVLAR